MMTWQQYTLLGVLALDFAAGIWLSRRRWNTAHGKGFIDGWDAAIRQQRAGLTLLTSKEHRERSE